MVINQGCTSNWHELEIKGYPVGGSMLLRREADCRATSFSKDGISPDLPLMEVKIDVLPVNDAPTISADAIVELPEGEQAIIVIELADVDTDVDQLTLTARSLNEIILPSDAVQWMARVLVVSC